MQDPSNTQNYNRYGYVLNNPLKYTDWTGEKWKIKLTWSDLFAGISIIAGTALAVFGGPAGQVLGAKLIGAGVTHFGVAFARYQSNGGSWTDASNYAGFSSPTISINTGWGDSKPDKNGVNQNEPVVKPKSDTKGGGNNGGTGGGRDNSNSNDSIYDFYGAKVMIASANGSNNWSLFGVIHTSRAFYDGYETRGLNSYEGLLLMHEYGHYLHSQSDPLNFYSYGMWSSMATAGTSTASSNWTEIKANTMSYYYFHYPSIYNQYKEDYPIDPNSISDELKYKLYYHLKL